MQFSVSLLLGLCVYPFLARDGMSTFVASGGAVELRTFIDEFIKFAETAGTVRLHLWGFCQFQREPSQIPQSLAEIADLPCAVNR